MMQAALTFTVGRQLSRKSQQGSHKRFRKRKLGAATACCLVVGTLAATSRRAAGDELGQTGLHGERRLSAADLCINAVAIDALCWAAAVGLPNGQVW